MKISLLGLVTLVPCSGAHAQATLDEIFGEHAGDRFGESVAYVGDQNADGAIDFVVGAPGDDDAGLDAGSLRLFSGADRSLLRRWDGAFPGSMLGSSVDSAGDVDHDGFEDVIAGEPGVDQAFVYSCQTGAVIHNWAPASGLDFGASVSGLGDVDGDGWADLAVGCAGGNALWVFSGIDGELLWNSPDISLAAAAAGDIDGDGLPDLITGDFEAGSSEPDGVARVYSGLSGALIREHHGAPSMGHRLGHAVCGVGDLNGDGRDDYALGAPAFPILHPFDRTYAEVRSGLDGTIIHKWEANYDDDFGWAVANAGDMDRDGVNDIVVSHLGNPFATVNARLHLYSGRDGSEIFDHQMVHRAGYALDGGADADGDGWLDILAGTPDDDRAANNAGKVSLVTLGCPPGAVTNYCTAVANSTGRRARMGWQNTTSIANNDYRLSAERCPPNKPGLFFYGTTPVQLPIGEGHLCATGSLQRLPVVNTGPAGTPSYALDFTNPPNPSGQISAGDTWYFSFWFRDPAGGPVGFNFADGLRATFCP